MVSLPSRSATQNGSRVENVPLREQSTKTIWIIYLIWTNYYTRCVDMCEQLGCWTLCAYTYIVIDHLSDGYASETPLSWEMKHIASTLRCGFAQCFTTTHLAHLCTMECSAHTKRLWWRKNCNRSMHINSEAANKASPSTDCEAKWLQHSSIICDPF